MEKIIEGKIYNTKTAKLLGSWSNRFSYSDFNHCEENLYITKKGQYFLAGGGGPMSKYAVSLGNNSTGGSTGIELLTEEEAKEWAENHLDTDEYMEAFPVEEG